MKSPFAPSLKGQAGSPINFNFSNLTNFQQSKTDFCPKTEEKKSREREREREAFVCGNIENYAWNKRGNDNFIV